MKIINEMEKKKASREELFFLRDNLEKGIIGLAQKRTGKSRSQVQYQLLSMPDNQDLEIINALREILFVVTGKYYKK